MSYSTKIIREQGGSVLTLNSGASLVAAAGAKVNLGDTQLLFGTGNAPTVSASPGSVYFRSDGSVSNIYINVSTGTTGSVWKGASIFS
jgi:hypothetical protein